MKFRLHPFEFDKKFEQEIEGEGHINEKEFYIAGVKNVRIDRDRRDDRIKLFSTVYLDELTKKYTEESIHILGRPIFPRPDYNPIYTYKKVKRKKLFSVGDIAIERTLDRFAQNINLGLITQLGYKSEIKDIIHLFEGVHSHYKEICQDLLIGPIDCLM